MAPPLSIAGVWQSLRWPTARDVSFSLKAYLAVVICLVIGFSQNLLNPYWSVLTVYIVLMQPESGAIRSKALYRLIGTVAGGMLIMVLTGVVGDQLGVLLTLTMGVITLATFARQIDRTPKNYIWFSAGLTAGFIGLVDLEMPQQIFVIATARIAEISVGIFAIAAVDSLIWPVPLKPTFMKALDAWECNARAWVTGALRSAATGGSDPQRRQDAHGRLRKLTATIGLIDGRAVQLPYDVVAVTPRSGDLDLLRRTVMHLIAHLAGIEEWTHAVQHSRTAQQQLAPLLDAVASWVDAPGCDGLFADVDGAGPLRARIAATDRPLDGREDRASLIAHGMLLRLDEFVRDWADLATTVRALRTRVPLPTGLRSIAQHARPVRSIDYLGAALDVLPMTVAMIVAAVLYYATTWSSGTYALLFSFIGCAFLIGQPATLRSGLGMITWTSIAFVAVFAYQFAILPRVTEFPLLIAVFGVLLFPVGLLLAMSPAGLFIAVFFFAFLSLQDVYTGNFEQSLMSLGGSLTGLLIAIGSLYLFSYDKPRFTARRVVRFVRLDVADAATARRMPSRERFLLLTIDRLTQFFPAVEKIGDDDPLAQANLIDDLRIGLNVLALRALRDTLPATLADGVDALLQTIGSAFTAHAHGAPLPDDLHARLGTLIDRACEIGDRADRAAYDAALVGLYLGLSPDEALFAQADADDGGSDAPGAGGPAKEGTEAPEPEGTPATEQPIDAKKDDDAGPQGDPKSDDEHSDGRRDAGRGAPDANTGADGRTHPNESRDRGEDRP